MLLMPLMRSTPPFWMPGSREQQVIPTEIPRTVQPRTESAPYLTISARSHNGSTLNQALTSSGPGLTTRSRSGPTVSSAQCAAAGATLVSSSRARHGSSSWPPSLTRTVPAVAKRISLRLWRHRKRICCCIGISVDAHLVQSPRMSGAAIGLGPITLWHSSQITTMPSLATTLSVLLTVAVGAMIVRFCIYAEQQLRGERVGAGFPGVLVPSGGINYAAFVWFLRITRWPRWYSGKPSSHHSRDA